MSKVIEPHSSVDSTDDIPLPRYAKIASNSVFDYYRCTYCGNTFFVKNGHRWHEVKARGDSKKRMQRHQCGGIDNE